MRSLRPTQPPRSLTLSLMLALPLAFAGCNYDDGDDGKPGPPPQNGGMVDDDLDPDEDPPGIRVEILSIQGGSGAGGSFQVGDKVRVRYSLKMDAGMDWPIDQLTRGRALVSGPTFNYQRVIAEQDDVLDTSVWNGDGTFTYTFPVPIPATYLPPYNDTPSFGADDGELTGQALLGGTYSVGLTFRWDYTVGTESFRDVGDAVGDFLFGGGGALASRELVTQNNCNRCHVDLQAHGANRKDVRLCLLCHTAGAEDRNDPNVEGGTPGASVEFGVMVHKIHSGKHLPSVNGVATKIGGTRDYYATPKRYKLVGFDVADFSDVEYPVWPNRSYPMPRDFGYSDLTDSEKAQEDLIRTGPTSCATCHGDPDGDGPLPPPAQGDVVYSQSSRNACGSCHDDIDWDAPYFANGPAMPPQEDDASCIVCHAPSGDPLAVIDSHRHPLNDPGFNEGLVYEVLALAEAGADDGDGTVDPGEKIEIVFTIRDETGADVDPADIASMSAVIAGPTDNHNLVLNMAFPTAALTGPQPYTLNVPERVQLERVGVATAGADSFNTAKRPHWNLTGATTDVFARTATSGGDSTLAGAADAPQNFIDVVDASGFDRDDFIAVDDGGGQEEYLRIQWVDDDRLWFSSPYTGGYPPGLRFDHGAGVAVREVALTPLTEGVEYTLNPGAGQIVEIAFTTGQAIVVSYTTDFVMPAEYPLALNATPDLGEEIGEWTGLGLVDGTYTLGLWGYRSLTLALHGETNGYRGAAEAVGADFLVGSAATVEPYDKIAGAGSCLSCHEDLMFHGASRRGFVSCIVCHGTAGSEDRPRYVAPGAPDTTGVTVNFRTMLHKLHMGEDLTNASTYTVVGFGSPANYPDNFSEHTYEQVVYPALPERTKDCASCHGTGNEAWFDLADRDHPTEQTTPVLEWTVTCGSCHDSDAAQAHIDQQTPGGIETCAVCHGEGNEFSVERVHKVR